jgi:hypothetical protein
MEGEELGRMARGDGQGRRAAFEGRDTLLQTEQVGLPMRE